MLIWIWALEPSDMLFSCLCPSVQMSGCYIQIGSLYVNTWVSFKTVLWHFVNLKYQLILFEYRDNILVVIQTCFSTIQNDTDTKDGCRHSARKFRVINWTKFWEILSLFNEARGTSFSLASTLPPTDKYTYITFKTEVKEFRNTVDYVRG
jgi:hypothetical protein